MPWEHYFLMTSSRCNRFLSFQKLGRLLRNATGTRICDRTFRYGYTPLDWKLAVPILAFHWRDGITEPVVVLYLQQHNVGIFQHDDARPHTVRHIQNILCIHNVNVLQRPARSSDLSPIEHLWDHQVVRWESAMMSTKSVILNMSCKLNWSGSHCRSLENWFCRKRRHCLAVLAANGGHTWYWAVSEFLRLTPWFISRTPETKHLKIMEWHWCESLVIRIKYLKMYLILWFPTYPFPRSKSILNLLNFFPSV